MQDQTKGTRMSEENFVTQYRGDFTIRFLVWGILALMLAAGLIFVYAFTVADKAAAAGIL
jgi:hypothetical protein